MAAAVVVSKRRKRRGNKKVRSCLSLGRRFAVRREKNEIAFLVAGEKQPTAPVSVQRKPRALSARAKLRSRPGPVRRESWAIGPPRPLQSEGREKRRPGFSATARRPSLTAAARWRRAPRQPRRPTPLVSMSAAPTRRVEASEAREKREAAGESVLGGGSAQLPKSAPLAKQESNNGADY